MVKSIHKILERNRLYIFPDGSRSLGWRSMWISGSSDNPIEVIDLGGISEKDMKHIENNLYDDKFIDKLGKKL